MSTGLIVTIAIAAFLLIIIIGMYNRLISRKNAVDYANGAVDAMYKQRFDLIPNLVAAVKQYMQHESGLLQKLTELRTSGASNPNLTAQERNNLDQHFEQAIKTFNITVENYPNLKASEQFSKLQASLNECEAQLTAARRTYNAAIMEYNNALEMFPSNIMANMMSYKRKEMITIPQSEKVSPNVGDLFN
ncbi:MAG: LemA family protein [Prevotellaceae bacterium]|jgi:LemA protein|nr:LemA family protein [Prevotellaceae bacterium]